MIRSKKVYKQILHLIGMKRGFSLFGCICNNPINLKPLDSDSLCCNFKEVTSLCSPTHSCGEGS